MCVKPVLNPMNFTLLVSGCIGLWMIFIKQEEWC